MAIPPDERPRLKEVFAGARVLPASDRQAYLAAVCAGNEALRLEVESLLAADERAKSFLESPAVVWGDGTPHRAQLMICPGGKAERTMKSVKGRRVACRIHGQEHNGARRLAKRKYFVTRK